MASVSLEVTIEQKAAALPAYVVVPAAKVARWKLEATTTIEGTLDGVALGRRSLKRWDEARWFVELTKGILAEVGKRVGDRAKLRMSVASAELPAELVRLIERDAAARARWEAHTDAQKRMLREHVFDARSSEARARRAEKALLPPPKPKAPRVAGLANEPRELEVRILARELPGRTCGPYAEVAVAFVDKAGGHPESFVDGGAREAVWQTRVEVRAEGGVPRFRGPAVNGPPHERFFYLAWIGRKGREATAMFRRAKLRLDAVPAPVLAGALRSGRLVGRVGLTMADGMPLCASVLPPAIEWSAG
jgi:hypothetical protein